MNFRRCANFPSITFVSRRFSFFILFIFPFIFPALLTAASSAQRPDRKTIEKHIDRAVEVFGHYAAVRLPLKNGVTLWNPTAIERGPGGIIFVANYTGEIYSLHDTDGDGLEDSPRLFCDVKKDGLRYPTSMIFKGNDLYVGTTQEVRIYSDTNGDGAADQSRTFFKDFPWTLHPFDWTFGLCFGPDEHLYLILSTDSRNPNPAPDPNHWRGSILRISPDGKTAETFAGGLRFTPGMDFNALGDLFFTDNKGEGNLTEEFNFAERGKFYGQNPDKFPGHPPTTGPVAKIIYGRGSGGICFNSPTNDFDGTAGDAFIACWGPDGQFEKGSITRIKLFKQTDGSYRAHEYPVSKIKKIIDLTFGDGGDLYVAQFGREGAKHGPGEKPDGAVYRFFYAPWVKPAVFQNSSVPLVKGDIKRGEKLFATLGCAACHAVDGTTQKLGPNLMGIGEMLSREEMMTSIREPSLNIKSGHETEKIIKKNGEIIAGCLVASDDREIVLMLAGNMQVKIPRAEIQSQQMLDESLMPPGMLDKVPKTDVDDLFAYLGIREKVPSWFAVKLNELRVLAIKTVPGLRLRYKVCLLITLAAIGGIFFFRGKKTSRKFIPARDAAIK